MIEDFDEWFAVRDQHDDDRIWPGRLSFGLRKGVVLEAISFPEDGNIYHAPNCDTGTITGYLDYQRPTTIINPWVQSRGGITFGADTPALRSKARLIGSAILKNMHLTDINEQCFTGVSMDLPAFSSWYAPDMVTTDFSVPEAKMPPEIAVDVGKPEAHEFLLNDGTKVTVTCYASTTTKRASTTVAPRVSLWLQFAETANYDTVLKRIWRVNILFSFLLGHRMAQTTYNLHTTHTRNWNGEDQSVTAELFARPAYKSKINHVAWYNALFTRQNCALDVGRLLNAAQEQSDALFYLMNMVLLMEHSKKLSANRFSEFMGCLEDFDITIFGSGSSSELKAQRKSLKKLVAEHGTDEHRQVVHDLIHGSPNRYSLAQRLERLQKIWSKSGFRGAPNPKELVKLRNDISHGRGVTLASDDYQKILWFGYYLCALSRFHIFRELGLPDQDIGEAFRRVAFRYGMYAPLAEESSTGEASTEADSAD